MCHYTTLAHCDRSRIASCVCFWFCLQLLLHCPRTQFSSEAVWSTDNVFHVSDRSEWPVLLASQGMSVEKTLFPQSGVRLVCPGEGGEGESCCMGDSILHQAWLMAVVIGCDRARWRWWSRLLGMSTRSLRTPFKQLAHRHHGSCLCVCQWVIVLSCIESCYVVIFIFLLSPASFPATDSLSLQLKPIWLC